MPEQNPFVPSAEGCAVLGPLDDESPEARDPVLVLEDEQCTCYWKQDRYFGEPAVVARVLLASRKVRQTLRDNCCALLLRELLGHVSNKLDYMATLGGIDSQTLLNSRGIVLSVDGYAEKLGLYLQRALATMAAYTPAEPLFTLIKARLLEVVRAWRDEPPVQQARAYQLLSALTHAPYPLGAYEHVLPAITLDDLRAWLADFRRTGVRIVALLEGNLTRERAVELVRMAARTLALPSAPREQLLNNQACIVARGTTTVDFGRHGEDANSAVVCFRCGAVRTSPEHNVDTVYAFLAERLLATPFYDTLRTKQQLGYVVSCQQLLTGNAEGLQFLVQSATHDPDALTASINAFLATAAPAAAAALTDEQFAALVDALRTELAVKDTTMDSNAARYWGGIVDGQLEFARDRLLREHALRATRQGLVDFVHRYLVPGAPQERAFVVRIWGNASTQQQLDELRDRAGLPRVALTTPAEYASSSPIFKEAAHFYHKVLKI